MKVITPVGEVEDKVLKKQIEYFLDRKPPAIYYAPKRMYMMVTHESRVVTNVMKVLYTQWKNHGRKALAIMMMEFYEMVNERSGQSDHRGISKSIAMLCPVFLTLHTVIKMKTYRNLRMTWSCCKLFEEIERREKESDDKLLYGEHENDNGKQESGEGE